VSLNLQPTDASINSCVVTSPTPATDDLVKSATAFSLFDGSTWKGSLTAWTAEQTHLIKMTAPATFTVQGTPITSVPVNPGWNWIAFASPTDLSSLGSITHSAGFANDDLLKSSSAFSMWGSSGFAGSLTDMSIGKGYLLKCANGGTVSFGGRRRTEAIPAPKPNDVSALGYGEPIVGATTAALVISLEIEGRLASSGHIAAFSAEGHLLGLQSAHANGKFYLSVASPLEPHSRHVHFKHTDEHGTTHTLDRLYQYAANDVVELELKNAPSSAPSTVAPTKKSSAPLVHATTTMPFSPIGAIVAIVTPALFLGLLILFVGSRMGLGKRHCKADKSDDATTLRPIPENETA